MTADTVTGNELLARALIAQRVETMFFLMGGPMLGAERAILDSGIRGIDVRHEQAAAMMAHAYARLLSRPGVCMAASGPGAINFSTGIANAFVDCAPVVALGGSSPLARLGKGDFQEVDQVALFAPITKWSARVLATQRIPELVDQAFRQARGGRPSPVYVDFPGDVLYREVDSAAVPRPRPPLPFPLPDRAGPLGDPLLVRAAVDLLRTAERPVILSGSGVL